jgi:hypothetical protein
VADAGYNLIDMGGLLLAWVALAADRLCPNDRHTYGWHRGSIMASSANAVILLVAMGSLAWEAVRRLHSQEPVEGTTVMEVAHRGFIKCDNRHLSNVMGSDFSAVGAVGKSPQADQKRGSKHAIVGQ